MLTQVLVEGVKIVIAMAKTNAFLAYGTKFYDQVKMPGKVIFIVQGVYFPDLFITYCNFLSQDPSCPQNRKKNLHLLYRLYIFQGVFIKAVRLQNPGQMNTLSVCADIIQQPYTTIQVYT